MTGLRKFQGKYPGGGAAPAAVGITRFVANNIGYTNQTTYAVISQATERTAMTSTLVKVAGFNLLVNLSATICLSTGAAQSVFIGVRINGVDYDVGMCTFSGAGTRAVVSGTRWINSLTASAGSWTVEPIVKYDTTSTGSLFAGDDQLSYSIQQVV